MTSFIDPLLAFVSAHAWLAYLTIFVAALLEAVPIVGSVIPGSTVILALSALALIIAVAGLAVVTAHGVTRRTREMGIRPVLGAEPGDLVRLMARRTLVAMTIGLAAGAVLAYAGAGLLKTVLFGIEPGDPRIFAAAMAVLLLVGGLAAWIPARRTGRIEPSAALRVE